MRKVEIRTASDINILRNLKGEEYLFVKIYNTFCPSLLHAVDLKNFRGTLDITFESQQRSIPCTVMIEKGASRRFFFMNIEKSTVLLPRNAEVDIRYQVNKNCFHIFSASGLERVSKDLYSQEVVELVLDDDLVLDKFPTHLFRKYSGQIILRGNHHQMYLKHMNSWKKFLEEHEVQLYDLPVFKVDSILQVKEAKDFSPLYHLRRGHVVVSLCNDISHFEIESILLNQFLGSLTIVGHSRTLSHFTIKNKNRTFGLISSFFPASNLSIRNLNLEHVLAESTRVCESAGVFLGQRRDVPEEVRSHFMPGRIEFVNCHVDYARLPEATHSGAFIGNGDDAMFLTDCSSHRVRSIYGQPVLEDIGKYSYSYLTFGPGYDETLPSGKSRTLSK